MSMRGSTSPGRLTLSARLAYGCGDLSSNLVWGLTISFLMYYYTDIYVIPAAVVAWLLLVPRIFDAFCDPLFGYLVDRSAGRIVLKLMRWLAVPFGLMAFFCFLPLPLTGTARIVWACGTYLVLGAVYSAINTPYGVLGNMMATTTEELVSLNAFRLGGCHLGQFLVAGAVLPAILWAGGGSGVQAQQLGVTRVAAVIGIAGAILWVITARGCKVRRPLPQERHSLGRLIGSLIGNSRFHLANALTYLNFTVFCAQGGLAIHYTRFVLHRSTAEASFLLLSVTACAFVGVALVPMVNRRLGLRRTYLSLLAGQALSLALMLVFSDRFLLFLALAGLHSLAEGPLSPLCYVILSQSVDEGHAGKGVAAAGLAFASNTLVSKVAAGMAGFVTATFLAFGHYAPGLVSADATLLFWLKAGYMGLPLACVAAQFGLIHFSYRTAPEPMAACPVGA